ncbi:MAG: MmgE/PrpD family protein [Rhodobiaceae bacterium]|nr:MmgE/PrpD family protein [Rhodobiaceae bacterium]
MIANKMSPEMHVSRRLSEFVSECGWSDLPDAVRREAARSIFNGFGTALCGAGDPDFRRVLGVMEPFSGPRDATVFGHGVTVDALTASFLNAASINIFDFDDTHDGTIIHPTAPVMPPLFALAEQSAISGEQLLTAFVLGVEVECRLGNAISPGHYRRGWHITSTCGVFGSAVAAGRLLGLDADMLLSALGIASAQSSGLVHTLGTTAKSIGVGAAARGGLVAALLAKKGGIGPEAPLEAGLGFLRVVHDDPDMASIVDGLGERWELSRNMYKPYPCGVVLNPVIDACLKLRARDGFDAGAVKSVVVSGHPLLKDRTDRPDVTTGRQAQVSAQHAISVALLFGAAGVAEFTDGMVADERVRKFSRLVLPVVVDEAVAVESARISVSLVSGEVIEVQVDEALGSLGNPLGNDQLEAKFRAAANHGCPELDVDPLIEALWNIAECDDAGALAALARP